ncbi:MAG: hypothetical protein IIB14_08775, partial [Chloroflexi bacterium]|nr:hypothetical protein [Chloroflexota bacterium]
MPDLSKAVLNLEDFPPGFEGVPSEAIGLGITIGSVSDEEIPLLNSFAFLSSLTFEVVFGFTIQIPDTLDRNGFDEGLRQTDFLLEGVAGFVAAFEGLSLEGNRALPGFDNIGDKSTAL